MRYCSACGRSFEPRASFHRLCTPCCKEGHDTAIYHHGYARGFERGRGVGGGFDPELVHDAVALCHPDRHPPERAGLATRTTQRLLELRERGA
jgi:hypothetical protein